MTTFATLRALHACIGDALSDLERVYKERSPSPSSPLDYPSLDVPHYPNQPISPADELAEQLVNDPSALVAIRSIVAACGQMSATVRRPWGAVRDIAVSGHLQACMRFMEEAHIVEILRDAGPQGMHVNDIHRAVVDLRPQSATPDPAVLTPERLGYILRVLATAHWLRELSPDVYANNRRSAVIDTGKTLEQLRAQPEKKYADTNGLAALLAHVCESTFPLKMTEWLLPDVHIRNMSPSPASSPSVTGNDAPAERRSYPTVFGLDLQTDLNLFEWLDLPENTFRRGRFAHAMTGTSYTEGTRQDVLQAFPWENLSPGAVLVDVGGGIGTTSLIVAHAHPEIRVVVEDRAPVVDKAPSAWGDEYAHMINSGRVSWRVRDFLTPWKPLSDNDSDKAPDVFLLRMVLHDWPDDVSRTILRQLRDAASPETRLVIGDALLLPACPSKDSLVSEDSPLLPNFGVANLQTYLIGIMMMGYLAAKERTVSEMEELLLSAGWKVNNVHRSVGSLWAYTTAEPV
ncbi:S-adenosyl-L-methionine-dependent methyltransferase [Cubamyces sp. BRFM 1775]|nr:S-adenosyl-L-methionine-dependent methyltransferase [Cubamyces sp. BRFM 1775]